MHDLLLCGVDPSLVDINALSYLMTKNDQDAYRAEDDIDDPAEDDIDDPAQDEAEDDDGYPEDPADAQPEFFHPSPAIQLVYDHVHAVYLSRIDCAAFGLPFLPFEMWLSILSFVQVLTCIYF